MECKVCGRTKSEVEEEFEQTVEIKEHQGIDKCSKCIREYETFQSVDDDEADNSSQDVDEGSWKDEIFA